MVQKKAVPMDKSSKDTFATPIERRHFEDYVAGTTHEFDGAEALAEAEIVEFARVYDAQFFHVDPVAALDGPFGALVASGWQTAALMNRLCVRHYLPTTASLGGHMADDLRWFRPLRPDEPLRLRVKVLATKPSKSKPDRGVVTSRAELVDADDQPVFAATVVNFIRRRTPGDAA
jgi:acyl dehydratase